MAAMNRVVRADRQSGAFEIGADAAVGAGATVVERQ
jgi:acetyltransferase-like isoleucine patch superfamily enzyme